MLFDILKMPENVVISTRDGYVEGVSNDIIPGVISILMQFRHALTIPVIYKPSASAVLGDIVYDTSNGVNDLLDGFD